MDEVIPPNRALVPAEPNSRALVPYGPEFAEWQRQGLGLDDALNTSSSCPVKIYIHQKGWAIPQYEQGTLFRATAVTPDIDEYITRKGFVTPYERGVTKGQLSRLSPDAPIKERVIEYVVPEGGGKFPRNANVVGLRADPFEAIRISQLSGKDTLAKPGAYMRLDEVQIYPGEVVDAAAIFKAEGLKPKYPPLEGEFVFDGSIPRDRIMRTIRFGPIEL